MTAIFKVLRNINSGQDRINRIDGADRLAAKQVQIDWQQSKCRQTGSKASTNRLAVKQVQTDWQQDKYR